MEKKNKLVKGILGVRHDPKKKMLFSFSGEDWPSDDSDDADYTIANDFVESNPDDDNFSKNQDAVKRTKKKNASSGNSCISKQVQTRQSSKSSKRKNSDTSEQRSQSRKKRRHNSLTPDNVITEPEIFNCVEDDRWQNSIPHEILENIFSFALQEEGIALFSSKMAKVCSTWHMVANSSKLWKHVDFSIKEQLYANIVTKEKKFIEICNSGKLHQAKELNLADWGTELTSKGIEAITENCPHLTTINLKNCYRLSSDDIRLLVDKCPNLSAFDLTSTKKDTRCKSNSTSAKSIKYLVTKCGSRLTQLSIAGNFNSASQTLIKVIAESCPNLQLLDASSITGTGCTISIPVEKLQVGCPHLKILRLANNVMFSSTASQSAQNAAPGFPELKELSIAVFYGSGLGNNDIMRLLKTSMKLILLDLRGCQRITPTGLLQIPAMGIEHLYLSKSSIASSPYLVDVINRWKNTLKEVDLSWSLNSDAINDSVLAFINATECSLEKLDLSGTLVDFSLIKTVLEECHSLTALQLQSCRNLPRGMKRLYEDASLKFLQKQVKDGHFDNSDSSSSID